MARWVKSIGTLKVDLLALRRALAGRDDVGWAAGAPKGTGRLKANVGQMWKFFTTSIYRSGDLPVIAAREALQNSVDAIRAAVRARKLRAEEGRFAVTWRPDSRTLIFEDNGIGMDEATIEDKFLDLGSSGKTDATSSADSAGGFGVAKAVILGVSETFRWELHSRNNKVVWEGFGGENPIFDAPMLAGTRLTIFDIPRHFLTRMDEATDQEVDLEERLRVMLGANDLPGIELVLNGAKVPLLFSRRAGSKVAAGGNWGPNTTATAKAYKRPFGDRAGAYYVRLNGLFQFQSPARRGGKLRSDIVIDLSTTTRPGVAGYPINVARDDFQGAAYWTMRDLAAEVERESLSTGRDEDFEVIDPEEDEGGSDIAEGTAQAFADEEFQQALAEGAGGLRDFRKEQAKYERKRTAPSSDAPAGTKIDEEVVSRLVSSEPVPEDAAGMIRALLGQAEVEPGQVVTTEVEQVLERAAAGQTLGSSDVATIVEAVDRATDAALDARGGGLLGVASVTRVFDALDQIAEAKPKRPSNPFGRFAGLWISRKNYDKARARRFRKKFADWIPVLTVWDATLRLIASEARMKWRFKPGFVLDDEVWGLTKPSDTAGAVVYLHPDKFRQAVVAFKQRPFGVASYLHGLACHELTHVDGYAAHDEDFVASREELARSTGHLLPAIAVLAARVLKLEQPKIERARVRELERELEKLRRQGGSPEGPANLEAAALRRELAAVRQALADAQAASEAVARQAQGTCPACDLREKVARKIAKRFAAVRARLPPGVTVAQVDDVERRLSKTIIDRVVEVHQARRKKPCCSACAAGKACETGCGNHGKPLRKTPKQPPRENLQPAPPGVRLVELNDGRWITSEEARARYLRDKEAVREGRPLDPTGDYGIPPVVYAPPEDDA